ncbi:MAG TPA: hypothetical protein VD767_00195, partial [Thermomicrobiales bacterium]|nr:hypothetical protein [Thermomicrobiales bacterium]
MVRTSLLRFLITMLVLVGSAVAPVASPTGAVVAAGDDDDPGDGNEGPGGDNDKDDDGNEGRGNDEDAVAAADNYQVSVSCQPGGVETICTFDPVAPDGGKDVSHLVVPEDVACADVIGGSGDFVDPDPNAHVTGYRFTGRGPYTLAFEGLVAVSGTATYWVKAASAVYPAAGPGLECAAGASLDDPAGKATPEPTVPAAPTTGRAVIEALGCPDVPADTSDFDWYGHCPPDGDLHRYLLSRDTSDTNPLLAAQTNASGTATFDDLGPGAYHLEDADARWCHAESDNVNADGNVVIEAGATTTV